jgi:signal transduction histidine kinase
MAIIAHDVRNPLASLKTSYELKNEGILSEEDIRTIDAIIPSQLDNTIQLLNNLVEWGKLQLSKPGDENSSFNLSQLCTKCFGYILLSAENKNNQLINRVNEDLYISGYPEQALDFVIRNLVTNANKFTSNGQVTIDAIKDATSFQIVVTDTGTGMTEEVRVALLDRKEMSTNLGTDNEKGSGLGLVLIHEYLQSLNGYLEIESTEGEGTVMSVILPVAN